MTSRDFCFWLQGYFEIHDSQRMAPEVSPMNWLTDSQVEMIKKHLSLVFLHEIDPSMGPIAQQKDSHDPTDKEE